MTLLAFVLFFDWLQFELVHVCNLPVVEKLGFYIFAINKMTALFNKLRQKHQIKVCFSYNHYSYCNCCNNFDQSILQNNFSDHSNHMKVLLPASIATS